jgi:hypothetical protein
MILSPALVDKYYRAAYIEIDREVYRVIAFDEDEEVMYVENDETGDEHQFDPAELATASRFWEIAEMKDE